MALPKTPKISSKQKPEDQYWEPHEYKDLSRIKSIFQWHETPADFKSKWVDYIEQKFDRRGRLLVLNKDVPTYITGTHYMYLQWIELIQPSRLS